LLALGCIGDACQLLTCIFSVYTYAYDVGEELTVSYLGREKFAPAGVPQAVLQHQFRALLTLVHRLSACYHAGEELTVSYLGREEFAPGGARQAVQHLY
jgi:hypothetical protein